MRYRWYFTAAATREYLRIAGLPDDGGGPNWLRAEVELGGHAEAAREVGANNTAIKFRTGRVQVGDRLQRVRLEFNVTNAPRGEGRLPQLVGVRAKTGHRGGDR